MKQNKNNLSASGVFNIFPALKVFSVFASLFALAPSLAFAQVLTLQPGQKTIENIAIAQSASAKVQDRSFSLTTLGSGLRSKHVAVVNVKVYVTTLMGSDAAHFDHSDAAALDSVANMQQSAIRMDFVRQVDSDTVQLAFRNSFAANGVDMNDASIKQFLDTVSQGGDAEQGKPLTIVMEHLPNNQEAVTYEDSLGLDTTIVGQPGFIRKILSIWLGASADSGLVALKQALLSGN